MELNNLLPLLGAIVPSMYQSRQSLPTNIQNYVFLSKFTHNLIWSLFVVVFTCLTLYLDILNEKIYFQGTTISITVLHYIIVAGIGSLLIFNYILDLLISSCNKKKEIWIAYLLLNIIVLLITSHILFIKYIYQIGG